MVVVVLLSCMFVMFVLLFNGSFVVVVEVDGLRTFVMERKAGRAVEERVGLEVVVLRVVVVVGLEVVADLVVGAFVVVLGLVAGILY